MLNYDMVVLGSIVALLRERSDNTAVDHGLALAVWMLPLSIMPLAVAHIPTAMLALPFFAGRLIWRLARAETRCKLLGDVPTGTTAAPMPQQ